MRTRREVLRKMGCLGIFLVAPVASVQHSREPVPFQTGQIVSPPIGCTELREADQEGDC